MLYEWDERKAAANLAKHGIPFDAVHGFDWETSIERIDDREDYGELRIVATGFIGVRLHILVYAPSEEDEDSVRIISLRKADKGEQDEYRKAQA
jgi:uncharacterized DUF497 family protein